MEANYEILEERVISLEKANIYATLAILPALLLVWGPYYLLWGVTPLGLAEAWGGGLREAGGDNIWLKLFLGFGVPLLIYMVGIVAHEAIHGVFFARAAKGGWRAVQFGVKWEVLTPYAHCTEALPVRPFRLACLMPCLILGVIPTLIGLAMGHFGITLFGFVFLLSAAGDLMILWLMRDVPKDTLVLDHPEQAGAYLVAPLTTG